MAIVIADQFNLEVNKSLDDRLVVDSTTTLYSKFNNLNSYIGMMVYVEAENAYYSLNEYTEAGNADSTCWSKIMSVSGDGETSVDHATSADQATSDSEGQNIAETYVKEIGLTTLKDSISLGDSGSDYSILVTKGDGTDYKVNIPLFTSSKDGLVPSPGASNTTKYLRGDGTWATPANTDTKVTNTLNTTSKAYITGTTSNTTNTGTQIFNTDHYIQGDSLYSNKIVPVIIKNANLGQGIYMGIKDNENNVITNNIVIGTDFDSGSNTPFIESEDNPYKNILNPSYVYHDSYYRIHFTNDIYGGDLVKHSVDGVIESTTLSKHWAIHQDGAASFNSIIVGGHIEYGKPGEDGLVIDQSNIYRAPLNSEIEANIHMSWENVHMYGASAVAMYTGGTLDHDNPKAEGNSYIYLDGSMGNIDIHSDGGADIDISGDSGAISITSNEDFRVDARGMYLTSTGTMEFKGNSKFKNSNGTILIQVNSDDTVKLRNSQGTNLLLSGTGIVSELESHTFRNKNSGDVALILDRGTKSNFKIINDGALHFQTDYTSTKGEYFDVLSINNNNGNATFKGTVTAPKFIGGLETQGAMIDTDGGNIFTIGGKIITDGGSINLSDGDTSKGSITGANTVSADEFIGALTGNADTATKLKTARTIALSGAATGTATSFDGTKNITIPVTTLDATKLTGMIPIASIPQGALERLVPVANQAARFALTADNVQLGDTVKEQDTGKMYYVVDTSKLNSEDGYEVYTAGAASSVPWSGITGKPSTFTPSSHTQAISTITGIKDLTIKLGSSGSTQTYNPSTALNLEVTPASIGAATSGHNHNTTYLKLSGGTMTGDLNMNGHHISNVGTIAISNRLFVDRISISPVNSTGGLLLENHLNMNNQNIIQVGTVSATTLEGSLTTDNLVDGDEELIIFGGTALD